MSSPPVPTYGLADITAFLSGKGGVGKSSVALGHAAASGRAHRRALLYDTDRDAPAEEIADAADKLARKTGGALGFDFDKTRDVTTIRGLRKLRGLYDAIDIDTPGDLDPDPKTSPVRAALDICDLAVILCVPERAAITGAFKTIRFINTYYEDHKVPYCVLITMHDARRGRAVLKDARDGFEAAGVPVLHTTIRRYTAWSESQLQGVMLHDYRGEGWRPAWEDMHDAYDEITGVVHRIRMARS